jgi:hypothetical protein
MKINSILSIITICFSLALMGQENERPDIIRLDSTWGRENFTFPLGFARDIQYQGFEEARFPKGWNDTQSPYFWTYTFAWNIAHDSMLTAQELENDMQYYFDGVMSLEIERKSDSTIANTSALFLLKESTSNHSAFIGKVQTWDHFTTKKPISLYVEVDQHYCKEQKKVVILFRFSPKKFDHDIWNTMSAITLHDNACLY